MLAWASVAVRATAGAIAFARLARGARRDEPLRPSGHGSSVAAARAPSKPLSVVIPARDEEARIGPALAALAADPEVAEVVVVDDESSDATAAVARAAGATVVAGRPLPAGWVGKPWALQQGLHAATGAWLVTLDADVEPRPGFCGALVATMEERGLDFLSVGGRFVCDSLGERVLHPAMLATLVYRFGPPSRRQVPPDRVLANGQCTITRRAGFAATGGYEPIGGHLTDDVALARSLARRGWRVGFADGTELMDVRMHSSTGDVWRNWGRSLPMPDVTSARAQALDLAVVWLAQALPLPRLLSRRGDGIDVVLLTLRLVLTVATASTYRRRGVGYWLSPLADVAAAARLTAGALRPGRTWRGRTYR